MVCLLLTDKNFDSCMQNYLRRWRAVWNPNMYHGWGRKRRYFEGWYFKIVDPTEHYAFAFIPGLAMDDTGESHAFVQVLDGKRNTARYYEWPAGAFIPSPHDFSLHVGDQFFALDQLQLRLPGMEGSIQLRQLHPWPRMLGAPGIMGWYSFVPFMECYHGIVSLDHQLEGQLIIDGTPVDFTGGKGYTEKDWGRSFPRCWIWLQTNHFPGDGVISLTASVAKIPWLGSHFIGYIVGFQWEGRLYRFATYTGAQMKAGLGERTVRLSFRDRHYRLEIEAVNTAGGELISPILGDMKGKLSESMQSTVAIAFYRGDDLLYQGIGRNAGLEVAGPVELLLTDKWRR